MFGPPMPNMGGFDDESVCMELDMDSNGGSPVNSAGTGSSRKSFSFKSKGKTKKKNCAVGSKSSSRSRSSSKISNSSSNSSNSGDGSASVGKVVAVVLTTIRLVIELMLSLCGGSEARADTRGNLARWINGSVHVLRTQPLYSCKMFVYSFVLGIIFVTALGFLGIDVGLGLSGKVNEFEVKTPSPYSISFFFSSGNEDVSAAMTLERAEGDAATEDDLSIPPPDIGPARKSMTKKLEIQFACDEVGCIEKCVRKVTKKCTSSEGCMRQRTSYCKKKCRKSRCESRCKFEPQIGYVEREMKLDKCKEECGNMGANSVKCLDKCEKGFQTCKSRCGERRKKFVCDREPDIPFPSKTDEAESNNDDDADDDFSRGSGALESGVDDEDI